MTAEEFRERLTLMVKQVQGHPNDYATHSVLVGYVWNLIHTLAASHGGGIPAGIFDSSRFDIIEVTDIEVNVEGTGRLLQLSIGKKKEC